jgi:hypothetical protein
MSTGSRAVRLCVRWLTGGVTVCPLARTTWSTTLEYPGTCLTTRGEGRGVRSEVELHHAHDTLHALVPLCQSCQHRGIVSYRPSQCARVWAFDVKSHVYWVSDVCVISVHGVE